MGFHKLFQKAHLIILIDDGKTGFQADGLCMTAQDTRAQRVKGANPPAFGFPPQQHADTLLHFTRRPVGEGNGQRLPRACLALHQNMGKPRCQHPGLAGTCPGQHQNRPLDGLDGLALGLVQAIQIGGSSLCRNQAFSYRFGGKVKRIGHSRYIA